MSRHQTNAKASKIATWSAWIGSVLEYYDFFIYATAASLIFPQVFFPASDPNVAIVASLATYGVGYVSRPIGAIFLGHFADRRGRKAMLVFCLFVMGFATMAVGLLPGYTEIGIAAPALLVVLRLIQGFAVAGEISGASSMVLEHAPPGRRGFYASFALQGVQAGQILAAAIFLPLTQWLSDVALMSWGWRVPFLLSGLLVVVGYFIRSHATETPLFVATAEHDAPAVSPIIEAFRSSWREMLRVTSMSLLQVIPVVATIFGGAYAVQPAYGIGLPKSLFLLIPVVCNVVAVVLIPLLGHLSDRIGRKPPAVFGAAGSGAVAIAYLYAIEMHSIEWTIALAVLMWGIVFQFYNAVFPSFLPEMFHVRTRVTAMAISQNLGVTISSLAPALFASIAPPGTAHIPLLVGSIALGISLVAALAASTARETFRIPIEELGPSAARGGPTQEDRAVPERNGAPTAQPAINVDSPS